MVVAPLPRKDVSQKESPIFEGLPLTVSSNWLPHPSSPLWPWPPSGQASLLIIHMACLECRAFLHIIFLHQIMSPFKMMCRTRFTYETPPSSLFLGHSPFVPFPCLAPLRWALQLSLCLLLYVCVFSSSFSGLLLSVWPVVPNCIVRKDKDCIALALWLSLVQTRAQHIGSNYRERDWLAQIEVYHLLCDLEQVT